MQKLVGRYIKNCDIAGFMVEDDEGNTNQFSKEHIIKMCKQGIVSNAKVTSYNGKDYLVGVGVQISKLPILNPQTNQPVDNQGENPGSTMRIVGRIVEDGETTGYVISEASGKQYKVSKNKAWILSMNHLISNTKIQLVNGVKLITGDGFELSSLPVMQ